MAYIVSKFGGTSLATLTQVDKAIELVRSGPYRKFVVVSAPGDRYKGDTKMTKLLLDTAKEYLSSRTSATAQKVAERLGEIGRDSPELAKRLNKEFEERLKDSDLAGRNEQAYTDSLAAFGEYAMANIMTDRMKQKGLDARMLDPKELGFRAIKGDKDFHPDPSSYGNISKALLDSTRQRPITIIPGFYAYASDGTLVTLPRGGSDTTGAVIANAVSAAAYENWTDEDGLRRADPRVVPDAELIRELTFREARELAQRGFKLQADSLLPLMDKHIPLQVRNTNNPSAPGTLVVGHRLVAQDEKIIGVAAKSGYIALYLEKMGMNNQRGFGAKALGILASNDVSYEHSPTGEDSMAVIIEQSQLKKPGKINTIIRELNEKLGKLEIELRDPMALVAVAGLNMRRHPEISGRVLTALGRNGIMPKVVNFGGSTISGFVGVDEERADDALRAIHYEFFPEKK